MKATCDNCHYSGRPSYKFPCTECYVRDGVPSKWEWDSPEEEISLTSVFVPCKIGDRVWAIRSYKGHKHPQDGIVSEMYFLNDMRLQLVVKHVARGEWGKTVFATREDAVAAILKERQDMMGEAYRY